MIAKKQFWKTAYLWIRYFNYSFYKYDHNKEEIWLFNRKSGRLALFKYGTLTTQALDFEKDKLQENHDQIKQSLDLDIKQYDIYIFTDKAFNETTYQYTQPVRIKFHCIQSNSALYNLTNHVKVKRLIGQDDKKTTTYYQKRVTNQNIIETSMYRFTPVTYALILINILIWLFVALFTNARSDIDIINLGALSHFNFVQGEWYRLVTSMFLHFDFEHILFNMLSLYIFGKLVEAIIGHWQMLVVYLLSGILGNVISLVFMTSSFSVGASGAIFGLLGALVTLMILSRRFTRKMLVQVLIAVIIMAVITLLIRNVNIVAHLAGILSGMFIVFLGYLHKYNRKYFIIFGILGLFILGLCITKIYLTKTDNIYNNIIQQEMNRDNYNDAKHMISNTMKHNYADDQTYVLSGMVIAAQDSKAEAINEWESGLRQFPNSAHLNYILALSERSLGDDDKAKKYIDKAYKADSANLNIKNLKNELDD